MNRELSSVFISRAVPVALAGTARLECKFGAVLDSNKSAADARAQHPLKKKKKKKTLAETSNARCGIPQTALQLVGLEE